MTPIMPAIAPHPTSCKLGNGSRVMSASATRNTRPINCENNTTTSDLARLDAMPPLKSPAPQLMAEAMASAPNRTNQDSFLTSAFNNESAVLQPFFIFREICPSAYAAGVWQGQNGSAFFLKRMADDICEIHFVTEKIGCADAPDCEDERWLDERKFAQQERLAQCAFLRRWRSIPFTNSTCRGAGIALRDRGEVALCAEVIFGKADLRQPTKQHTACLPAEWFGF